MNTAASMPRTHGRDRRSGQAEFKVDPMVQQLVSAPTKGGGESDKSTTDPAAVCEDVYPYESIRATEFEFTL